MKTLYQDLLHARNTMLLAQDPMNDCIQNFQKQCKTILSTTDESLIKQHYEPQTSMLSFFCPLTNQGFIKQYQDFKQSIDKITLDIEDECVMVL